MTDHSMHRHGGQQPASHDADTQDRRQRRGRWVFGAFLAIAGVYLVAEHRAHLGQALPLLILLACPLLHMFMHGGHGGHGGRGGHGEHGKDGDQARRERDWEGS